MEGEEGGGEAGNTIHKTGQQNARHERMIAFDHWIDILHDPAVRLADVHDCNDDTEVLHDPGQRPLVRTLRLGKAVVRRPPRLPRPRHRHRVWLPLPQANKESRVSWPQKRGGGRQRGEEERVDRRLDRSISKLLRITKCFKIHVNKIKIHSLNIQHSLYSFHSSSWLMMNTNSATRSPPNNINQQCLFLPPPSSSMLSSCVPLLMDWKYVPTRRSSRDKITATMRTLPPPQPPTGPLQGCKQRGSAYLTTTQPPH